jgi:hypothetical protein
MGSYADGCLGFIVMKHSAVTVDVGGGFGNHCATVGVDHAAELVTNYGGRVLE